ncbi:MAG: Unknown protein [uncultured Sulfurovum sp.]|uniref:Uncharacterized protein n=1 Tax=uncultured Sulfurovum sp. TaxID=269237 RepID=A0A6S6SRN2_9BACT|nr:MAG: Unknown protein [uncultured Sulfurovum sp.]
MYSICMKKIYILISLTLMLMAAPLTEEKALELFETIKNSEYSRVVALWDNEMKIKSQSRSSGRKSLWDDDEDPIDAKDNASHHGAD